MSANETGVDSVTPAITRLTQILALLLSGFVIWTAVFGNLPNIQQRSVILCVVFAMGYLLYPTRISILGGASWVVDLVLFGATAAACLYVFVNYYELMMFPAAPTQVAVVLGVSLCVAVFELSRRTVGWSFGILMLVFTAYALWGHYIPGRLGHAPFSASLLVDALYLGTDGLWGSLLDVYASLLILFILFSSLMMATGAGESFINLGKLVAGRHVGGPAKIAVIASAFIGSVTGSSVTNVAMTGAFTIPLMKRLGYRPSVAAAIEATASSGGQITPPMMGAGLFLMAELLGLSVSHVMLVALIPALLFYVGLLSAVHFESCRQNIAPIPAEDLPCAKDVLAWRAIVPVTLPFVCLIATLVVGYSAQLAILAAMSSLIVSYMLCAVSLKDVSERLRRVVAAVANSAQALVTMGSLIAAASLVVAVISFFGVGPKLSELVISLGQGSLLPTLLLSGLVVIVIGMGVPTTAAYVLGASVIAIALRNLGIPDIPAHMFIFYLATLSAITPPVCAAVFVAADIAATPWLPVAWQTMRFAVIKYFLPFIFVFHPPLLLIGDLSDTFIAFAFAAVGAIGLSASFAGYLFSRLKVWQSFVLGVCSIMILWPEFYTSLLGLVPLCVIGLLSWRSTSNHSRLDKVV